VNARAVCCPIGSVVVVVGVVVDEGVGLRVVVVVVILTKHSNIRPVINSR